jgi:hypothetical protein
VPRRHDLAHERLPRDDADQALVVADEDGADIRVGEELAGLLRRRLHAQGPRLDQHRLADERHG